MDRRYGLALVLAMIGFSGTEVGASAISYKVENLAFSGLSSYSGGLASDFSFDPNLPDLNAGGAVSIGLFSYENSLLPGGEIPSQLISGSFSFLLQGYDSLGNAVGPAVNVAGQYQGTYYTGGPQQQWYESFLGTVTGLNSEGGDPVPEALQNLVDNPGRMSMATVSLENSGHMDEWVNLTIAPTTAPEPSTLVTMLSAASLIFLARKRLRWY